MPGDSGRSPTGDDDDSFLRAIAAAPKRSVGEIAPPHPERIAHFRIDGRLGAGGMGVVYSAQDESLRREVAIKLLPAMHASDPGRRQRFLREARAAAALVHPNVAVVYQVGEAEGRVFITMELVAGATLRRLIDRGPIAPRVARKLAHQMASGLAAAHAKGIVHRDLKPENVMVTPSNVVKLLDFGLAKSGWVPQGGTEIENADTEAVITREGDVVGSSAYMSPEQALGSRVDARSDVFSFGIVLYEMLAGERPFGGETLGEVRGAIARDDPAPLSQRAPEVDAALEAIVTRCLAKRVAERFEDAGAVVRALEALGPLSEPEGHSSGRNVSTLPPAAVRRRRLLLASVPVAAMAAAGVALLARSAPVPAPPVLSADASPAPAPTVDDGAVASTHPDAQRAYEAALRALHTGDVAAADGSLARAVDADPGFSGAQLRRAIFGAEALGEAERSRAAPLGDTGLSTRDRALLSAYRAALRGKDAAALAAPGLDRDLAQHPHDEVAWVVRWLLATAVKRAAGADVAAHAREANPSFVEALALGARSAWETNEGEARALLDRCLAEAPRATSCLRARLELERTSGRCEDMLGDARSLLEVDATDRDGHDALADALASTGAPVSAIAEALGPLDGTVERAGGVPRAALLPLYEGDFIAVTRVASDLASRPSPGRTKRDVAHLTTALLLAATESGDAAGAARIAEDFEGRSAAWDGSSGEGPWMPAFDAWMVSVMARQKRLAREDADQRIASLMKRVAPWSDALDAWGLEHGFAETPGEAQAALAAFDRAGLDAEAPRWRSSFGRTFFLAGTTDRARAALKREAAGCAALTDARATMRAQLELGRLDEREGDESSACAHYAAVLARWGHAKPKSVTADEARARAVALKCAGASSARSDAGRTRDSRSDASAPAGDDILEKQY